MVGLKLFVHSVKLVFSDPWITLKLFCPYLVSNIILFTFLLVFSENFDSNYGSIIFIASIFSTLCFIWSAVSYHRYILIDDHPGFILPSFRFKRIMSYFGYAIKIFIAFIPIFIVIVLTVTAFNLRMDSSFIWLSILGLFISIPLYRLSTILPAAALGQPLSLRGAWAATKGASLSLLSLAVISLIAGTIIGLPPLLFGTSTVGLVLAAVWNAVSGLLSTIVFVSILTTLYGFYVEKRPIGTLVPS